MSRILLLEDDANLNETVAEFLEEQGHNVVSVYNGNEAQEKIYESKYDLLLLDINVPGMNGLELLKESRKEGISTPAIYITSMDTVDDLEKGFNSGCDDIARIGNLKIAVTGVDFSAAAHFLIEKGDINDCSFNCRCQ